VACPTASRISSAWERPVSWARRPGATNSSTDVKDLEAQHRSPKTNRWPPYRFPNSLGCLSGSHP
jgi:hypothetical protein